MAGELDSFNVDPGPRTQTAPATHNPIRNAYRLIAEHEHVRSHRAHILDEAKPHEVEVLKELYARDYFSEYPDRDICYMGNQVGWHSNYKRPFTDFMLIGEPWRRARGSGTARMYLGSSNNEYTGKLHDDVMIGNVLGLYVDHDSFEEDGGSTFFHLWHTSVEGLGNGRSRADRFLAGANLVLSLAVELDPTDKTEYANFREMVNATCTIAGC
jgi:hypothetical protein